MRPALWEGSVRRSRVRRDVLVMLASLSESAPRALASACGIDSSRLRAVMVGRLPDFSPDLALVPLGLAAEVRTPRGRIYAITPSGRRKARQLTARAARKASARATWRTMTQVSEIGHP